MSDDKIDLNSVEIDLSSFGAAQDTISVGSGTDTITITGLDTMASTISIPPSYYSITNGGAVTSSSTCYTTNWGTISGSSGTNINIDSDGIYMPDNTDIKIGNKSLKDTLEKMEERLAILTPDPEKLKRFEALKKAYEHYKLMEKLCQIEDEEK